ncbi:MAG TPA: C13 family peptidase [Steroidobacteraceae bacterium]|nr:C13 family peptidase [Steroidobacteraceae bacterium]
MPTSLAHLPAALALLTAAGSVLLPGHASSAPPAPQLSIDRLMFVDCLLPGQFRKLGGKISYLGPRRPIRTTVDDCEIRGGEYVAYDRANYATALQAWLPQAQQGDPQAEVYVGEIYEKGLGTAPDYALAASWYDRAARQKSPEGASHLAYLYEEGLGVEKDPVRALNLYRTAAGLDTDALTFQSQLTDAQAQLAQTTRRLEEQTQASASLSDQLRGTQDQLDVARAQTERLTTTTQALRKKLAQSESADHSGVSAAELAKLRSELEAREQDVARHEAAIAALQRAASEQSATLESRISEMERDNRTLTSQLESASTEVAALRSQLAAAQAKEAALEQQAAELRAKVQQGERTLQGTQQALRSRESDNKAAGDAAQRAAAATQMELQRQRDVIRSLDTDRDSLTAEVKRLQSSLESAQSALHGTQDAQQQATRDTGAARARIATLQAQVVDSDRHLQVLSVKIQQEEEQIAVDRAQLQKSAIELGARDAQIKQLNQSLADRETALARERSERAALLAISKADQDQMRQLRGAAPAVSPPAAARTTVTVSAAQLGLATNYALVIANAHYQQDRQYPSLTSVEKDGQDVTAALERYGFKGHTTVLADPTGKEMMNAVAQFLSQTGPNDSVLIYYAGHGALMDATSYWLPKDADPINRATWVSTGWVTEMIHQAKARHVLLVVDSCYAGVMVRSTNLKIVTATPAAEPDRVKLLARLPSRTVLTSGGNEPVVSGGPAGNSVFAGQFIRVLEDNRGVLDGSALYEALADGMDRTLAAVSSLGIANASQHPRYAVLANAGHLNGDFLFVPAQGPLAAASAGGKLMAHMGRAGQWGS